MEIDSILRNEEEECREEGLLTEEEIFEYLIIIELEIETTWTHYTYIRYWESYK